MPAPAISRFPVPALKDMPMTSARILAVQENPASCRTFRCWRIGPNSAFFAYHDADGEGRRTHKAERDDGRDPNLINASIA